MRVARGLVVSGLAVTCLGGCNQIFSIEDPNLIPAPSPLGPPPYALTRAGTKTASANLSATSATIANRQLNAWTAAATALQGEETPKLGSNGVFDSGGGEDGPVLWGRWAGGTTLCCLAVNPRQRTFPLNGGLHYALGRPSPTPTPASGTLDYKVVGSTRATSGDGTIAPGTITGTASLLFAAKSRIGLALKIQSDVSYTVTTGADTPALSTSPVVFDNPSNVFTQATPGTADVALVLHQVGRACDGGPTCFAQVSGFIAGTDYERMALVIQIFSGTAGDDHSVTAVAILAKQ